MLAKRLCSRPDGAEGKHTFIESKPTLIESTLTIAESKLTLTEGKLTLVEGKLTFDARYAYSYRETTCFDQKQAYFD